MADTSSAMNRWLRRGRGARTVTPATEAQVHGDANPWCTASCPHHDEPRKAARQAGDMNAFIRRGRGLPLFTSPPRDAEQYRPKVHDDDAPHMAHERN